MLPEEFETLVRTLSSMGLIISSVDRDSLVITVRVPPLGTM